MNVTEDVVRRSLLAHEAEAPDDSGLLVSVRAGVARRRRLQWVRAAGAAAAVVAVVAGATLVADAPSRGSRRAVPPAASPAVPIPAGTQPVSFHGVTVFVPLHWRLNALRCGTPVEDTVVVSPGPILACALIRKPLVTVVDLEPLTAGRLSAARRGRPEDRRYGDVRTFPDVGVLVSARSLDRRLVRRILDSARLTPVDAFGCRDRAQSLKPTAKPSHPGAAVNLVPGSPRSATICRYEGDWLARSVRVPPNQLATLTGILNRLPAGRSRPGPNTSASARSLEEDRHRGFVVQFTYASRSRLDVYVHIGDRNLTAANGARTTKIDEPLVTTLLSLAGYDASFPNPREYR
jgi:hypothetical protein